MLPFMISRLPPDLADKISLIALLGLGEKIDFEIHASDVFDAHHAAALPVRPEIEKLKGKKILCFHGVQETDSLCPGLPELVIDRPIKGGHHFGGDFKEISNQILLELKD